MSNWQFQADAGGTFTAEPEEFMPAVAVDEAARRVSKERVGTSFALRKAGVWG
jgi:hypothetical protein